MLLENVNRRFMKDLPIQNIFTCSYMVYSSDWLVIIIIIIIVIIILIIIIIIIIMKMIIMISRFSYKTLCLSLSTNT